MSRVESWEATVSICAACVAPAEVVSVYAGWHHRILDRQTLGENLIELHRDGLESLGCSLSKAVMANDNTFGNKQWFIYQQSTLAPPILHHSLVLDLEKPTTEAAQISGGNAATSLPVATKLTPSQSTSHHSLALDLGQI